MLQRYVHFVQCIHKTHSQHAKKRQGNIRIVLTLSILKNKKNTVTTDWIENKINKFHNAYLCFKVGNWNEKKNSLLCFVLFANMSLVHSRHFAKGNISNFSILTFRDNLVFMRVCCQTMT